MFVTMNRIPVRPKYAEQFEEAFRAWTESPAFKEGHARSGTLPKEAFLGPNRLEAFEVVLDSEGRDA
mgnify:FL=1